MAPSIIKRAWRERGQEGLRRPAVGFPVRACFVTFSLVGVLVSQPAPARAVNFDYYTTKPVLVDTLRALVKIVNYVKNNEPIPQSFTITKAQEMPPSPGWWASICVNDFCLAPFVNSWDVYDVPGGDSIKVSSWVQCDTVAANPGGSGHVTLTVMPYETPMESKAHLLTAITDNIDVLVVDDDGDESYEPYFLDALPPGKSFGRWPHESLGPDSASLARFPQVIWFAGEESPALDASDRAAISGYLSAGGKVLLSGQNIAYDLCDAASPHYSPEACAWLEQTFHATYVTDNTAGTGLVSAPDDSLIGPGVDLEITGGTGAGNQSSPDGIAAADGGVSFLVYRETDIETENIGGVRNCSGSPNTVFLSFGFEGIADEEDRRDLMQRVLGYLDPAAADVECPTPPTPPILENALGPNTPNPFFLSTELPVQLVGPAAVTLGIYDIGGRLVRTLVDGPLPAGETLVVWDGRNQDGEDVPSGIYFARLVAPERTSSRKMNFVR